jgi:simple sugar transport system substrate-binding protein
MTDLQKRTLLRLAALTAVASATLAGCGKKRSPHLRQPLSLRHPHLRLSLSR